jgi:hypothetical protein
VGDLWTGFIWHRIRSSGRFVDWTGLGVSEGFLDWIEMAQDRDQWEICGLD